MNAPRKNTIGAGLITEGATTTVIESLPDRNLNNEGEGRKQGAKWAQKNQY
jgi:hypothetical protein